MSSRQANRVPVWMGANNRAIAIIRVSTRKQGENNSPSIQREDIEAYAGRVGLKLERVAEIHESAKTSKRRTKFKKALEEARKAGIRHVICWRFDRHTRNFTDLESMRDDIAEGSFAAFHIAADNKVFHRETPRSEWMMAVVQAIGAWQYSEDVTERATAASKKKVRDGWFPGRAKLGYRNVQLRGADGRKSGRNGIIVPTPEGRQLIRRMYAMRVELGYSLGRIAEAVKDEGLLRPLVAAGLIKPTFERAFNAERVRTALINPFYKGMMELGGQVHPANHEAMLTEEEWDRLQATFGKRAAYTKRKHEGALSGFLRCGCCGCAMVFDPKTKKSGRTYRYYACSNMRRQHTKRPRTTEEKLFEMFAPMADAIQIDQDGAQQLADALNELEKKARAAHHVEVKSFKAQLVGLEDCEDELYRDMKMGLLSETAYHRHLERVRADRRRYTDLLAQAQSGVTSNCLVTAQRVSNLALNAKSLWMSMTPHERRIMLDEVVSNPIFDGEKVTYELKKPFRMLSEMRESGKWRARHDSNV